MSLIFLSRECPRLQFNTVPLWEEVRKSATCKILKWSANKKFWGAKMMKKTILMAGFTVLSFILPFRAAAATFSRMYVFGDSLSDPGNVFNVTEFTPGIPTIPESPPTMRDVMPTVRFG